MEPIISPWVIYLFSVLTKLNMVASAVAIFSCAVMFFMTMLRFIYDDMKIKINYKNVTIVTIIATILVIIIPNEKTMLAMLTLSFITPDNVVIAENHIIDLITKIMDAVNSK